MVQRIVPREQVCESVLSVEQICEAVLQSRSLAQEDVASEADSFLTESLPCPVSPQGQGGQLSDISDLTALSQLWRSGSIGAMSSEACATLLAGTLYEYEDSSLPQTPMMTPAQVSQVPPLNLSSSLQALDESASRPSSPVEISRPDTASVQQMSTERSDFLWQTAQELFGDSSSRGGGRITPGRFLGRTMTVETLSIDDRSDTPTSELLGGVSDMLREMMDGDEIDFNFSPSARRMLQLGALASGQRLTQTEIQELPKIRFSMSERQSCAICLESYSQGELLTELRCSHFFHTECLTKWLQRSTQCPLCRSSQCEINNE